MKKLFFLFLLVGAYNVSMSQGSTNFKVGIYKNFEEFKNNSPSLPFTYTLKEEIKKYSTGVFQYEKLTFYHVEVKKSEVKDIGEVYGFSDGNYAYINPGELKFGPKVRYCKIEAKGSYAYFKDLLCVVTTTSQPSPIPGNETCSLNEKIIDMNSGKVMALTRKKLKEIIADDSDLLSEFENENNKKSQMGEYLIKYMERKKS